MQIFYTCKQAWMPKFESEAYARTKLKDHEREHMYVCI